MATTRLPPDFRELLQLLAEKDVRFLVIGGYAVAYHGYARATVDLDIWVGPGEENAKRLADAVRGFGLGGPDISPELFMDPDSIVQFGVPPLRLKFHTTISGVTFDECYDQRDVARIDDVEIPFIDLEHLKANKRASGRPKDRVDVRELSSPDLRRGRRPKRPS